MIYLLYSLEYHFHINFLVPQLLNSTVFFLNPVFISVGKTLEML